MSFIGKMFLHPKDNKQLTFLFFISFVVMRQPFPFYWSVSVLKANLLRTIHICDILS